MWELRRMRIPELKGIHGFQDVTIDESGERLIDVKGLHSKIHVRSIYREWGIPTSVDSVYVRQDVAERLVKVATSLYTHTHLLLWDGWRPVSVQQALFEGYVTSLMNQNPHLSLERLNHMASDFVSIPSKDLLRPSTHSTGGAVDITLCDNHGIPLNLGTSFADFTSKANTRYLEKGDMNNEPFAVKEARQLRRELFHAMTDQGFTNFLNEWWHYDFGNQWWGVIKGERAKYGYIELPA